MYAQVLRAQWLSTRQAVVIFTVLCFAAPLTAVYVGLGGQADSRQVQGWLVGAERVGYAIPVLAVLLGVMFGLASWTADHLGRHVYAMSLPVARSRFVLLRFAAGLTLVAAPVLALGVGAAIATAAVKLPEGIHAYPLQLTLRFAFATLVMFALFFALSIATKKVVLGLLGTIGGLLFADLLLTAFSSTEISVTTTVLTLLIKWPGPLAILVGRWALFDV